MRDYLSRLPGELLNIAADIVEENPTASAYLMGGAVRDLVLEKSPKDFDVEVYGVTIHNLVYALKKHGKVDIVGQAFGVIKLKTPSGLDLDFSVPRTENKVGKGHKGFEVTVDSNLTPTEAILRRDLTVNGLMLNLRTGEILDTVGGLEDLESGILRHISGKFAEDPLRVLRIMQFAGRFGFQVHPETTDLCKGLAGEYETIARERIWTEWEKLALKSTLPSAGLRFMKECEWAYLYPSLPLLFGVPQNPEWHPEGDVDEHTFLAADEAVRIAVREKLCEKDRLVLFFAALTHDFGKPSTTKFEDGAIRSRGHEEAGIEPAEAFLKGIGAPAWLIEMVLPLVGNHLAHLSAASESDRNVRRLSRRLGSSSIRLLVLLVEADHSARSPLPKGCPEEAKRLLESAERLRVKDSEPQPILKGRHLVELGMKPSPSFSEVLKKAYELQLDGRIEDVDDGKFWVLKSYVSVRKAWTFRAVVTTKSLLKKARKIARVGV